MFSTKGSKPCTFMISFINGNRSTFPRFITIARAFRFLPPTGPKRFFGEIFEVIKKGVPFGSIPGVVPRLFNETSWSQIFSMTLKSKLSASLIPSMK